MNWRMDQHIKGYLQLDRSFWILWTFSFMLRLDKQKRQKSFHIFGARRSGWKPSQALRRWRRMGRVDGASGTANHYRCLFVPFGSSVHPSVHLHLLKSDWQLFSRPSARSLCSRVNGLVWILWIWAASISRRQSLNSVHTWHKPFSWVHVLINH